MDLVNLYYQVLGELEFPLGAGDDAVARNPKDLAKGAYLVGISSALANVMVLLVLMHTPYTQRVMWPLPLWWCLAAGGSALRATSTVTSQAILSAQDGAVQVCVQLLLYSALSLAGLFDLAAWLRATMFSNAVSDYGDDGSLQEPLLAAVHGEEDAETRREQEAPPSSSAFASGPADDKGESVADTAGVLSKLSFAFLFPMLAMGFGGTLTQEKLLPVPKPQRTSTVNADFLEAWSQELARSKKPNLANALVHAFGRPFILASIFKAVYDCLQFVGPQVLHAVITYLDPNAPAPAWVAWVPEDMQGYYIVAVLFFSGLLQTAVLHQYFYRVFNVGMNLRAAVVLAVYRKSLTISSATRQESNTGTIVNLMSTDATRLQDVTTYFAVLWSAPLQIGLSLYFLWQQVSYATFAGVGVMIVSAPVNGYITRRLRVLAKAVMKVKDERINKTNEVVNAIKLVKCNGWEEIFKSRVMETRRAELYQLAQYILFRSAMMVFFTAVPLLVSTATFFLYVSLGNTLTAAEAFTAISLFNILRFPLAMLPNVINNLVEARVSLKRIQDFLEGADLDPTAVMRQPTRAAKGEPAVVFSGNATFSWGPVASSADASAAPSPTAHLKDMNFTVRSGELLAVVGPVGCGKSTLLNACIGELTVLSGNVKVCGKVAYAPQTAFILNGTLRENVLFGNPWDPELYARVIEACCLQSDIDLLQAGDATEIGTGGINLSGGQRQRVSLARALYSQADVYLFDDVLSAVDAHVGAAIFQKAILGELADKTRVLVTHGMQYLAQANHVLTMSNGGMAEYGTYKDLTSSGSTSNLAKLVETYEGELANMHGPGSPRHSLDGPSSGRPSLDKPPSKKSTDAADAVPPASASNSATASGGTPAAPVGRLTQAENTNSGALRKGTYAAYIESCGGYWVMAVIILLFLAWSGTQVAQNSWLSYWSEHREDHSQNWFLNIYVALGASNVVVLLLRNLIYALCGLLGAHRLHEKLLYSVLRAPMSFFHTTPMGRVLNRFSQDTYTIDEKVADTLSSFFGQVLWVVSTVVVVAVATPRFLVAVPIIVAFYTYVQNFYVPASRELKRLDSVARSPIYSHFSETLQGSSTVRAYTQLDRFMEVNRNRLDGQLRAYYWYITSNRWLAVRLETVGTIIVTCAAMLAVSEKGTLAAGLAGLSISYALNVTQSLNWLVRMASDRESQVVSIERVAEFAEMESEPALTNVSKKPPQSWPSSGRIELRQFSMAYRRGLPYVLNSVNCVIEAQSKVGICGRTGAGKSSIMVSLMRLADVTEGQILIDDADVLQMGLHDVRTAMALIPQEATLFGGTLRHNLDPLNRSTDSQLWDSLGHVQLAEVVRNSEGGLDAKVAEEGENWSHGQRQLICMARALLKGCRIILLDEATASCDVETDAMLQKTIRTIFQDCTTLTIAHRLHTISDSDRIMVLGEGKILEYDTPRSLVKQKGSVYRKLVDESKSG